MRRAGVIGVAMLSLGVACTEKGRSVVLVDVTSPSLTGDLRVLVHVTQGTESINHVEETGALPLHLGVYLPKTVSGAANVEACAFNATNELVGGTSTPIPITVVPGGTIGPMAVELQAGASPAVCRGSMSSGHGGGGGSVGGSGGTGGSVGGTGGSGGSAGAGGRGGAAGTTGGAGGSAGGSGGTSGTVGTGGRGGAAGSGGTGGTAGSGGPGWQATPMGVSASPSAVEKTPSVAVSYAGKAVIVFDKDGQIFWSCYDDAGLRTWSNPMPLSASPGTYQDPVVAVDGPGRFTAVWSGMGATTGIFEATTNGTDCNSWMPSMPLSAATAVKPAIAVNSDGVAVVVWGERDPNGNMQPVVSLRQGPTASWQRSFVNGSLATDASDRNPVVGIPDVGGKAFILWEQPVAGVDAVWWRVLDTASNGWATTGNLLSTDNTMSAHSPAIATNPAGNAIATYLVRGANTTQLWSRRWTAGGSDFAGALMAASGMEIDDYIPPAVMLDSNGVATVAFGLLTGATYQVTVSRSAAADSSWPAPPYKQLETDDAAADDGAFGTTSFATMPVLRGDGQGNVFAVWRKRIAATRWDLFASRFSGGSWSPTNGMRIENTDVINSATTSVFNPALGVNGAGMAVATWYYSGGAPDVYANIWR